MLSKKRRVGRELFSQILTRSKSFYGNNLSLRVFKTPHSNKETKFSFIVSKKVSNKAVKRNLLKKRGYYAVKKISKNLNNGFVCMFFLKNSSILLSYTELEKEILFLLKKANVLK